MGPAVQPAPARNAVAFHYERRRPEETTLYQVVQEQLETFLAQVEAQTGPGLPAFVKDEFEAFLQCGIPRLRGGRSLLAQGLSSGCAVPSAPMRSWLRFPASAADFAPRVVPGAWPRAPRTWSIRSSRTCRSGNGCARFRSGFASSSPPIPNCSRPCCRLSTGSSRAF